MTRVMIGWIALALLAGCADLTDRAKEGNLKQVRILLDAGAEVNERDDKSRTPLWYAVDGGHLDVVRALLLAGAEIDADPIDGEPALVRAVRNGDTLIVEILLDYGADIDVDREGRSILLLAVQSGDINIVSALVTKEADVNTATSTGYTPLMCAAEGGHADMAKLLLKHGAHKEARDREGNTALSYAQLFRKRILLSSVEAVDFVDKQNRPTPGQLKPSARLLHDRPRLFHP